ncbi:MAG: helix-turn-helix domain-containing protein [Clostridia bacterium]|nr:helix-turn-helix domain-containing protein [Clostridia bacterium]
MLHNKFFSHNEDSTKDNEGFTRLMLRDAELVKPILKERFLRDYIFGVGDAEESFRLYCGAFGVKSDMPVRVSIISTGECMSKELRLTLMNVAEQLFGRSIILNTQLFASLFLILEDMPDRDIKGRLLELTRIGGREEAVFSVYSVTVPLAEIPSAFERIKKCLEYSFYTGSFDVMCEDEMRTGAGYSLLIPKYMGIERAVVSGDEKKTKSLLTEFYNELEKCMPPPAVAKTYCLELYVCIIRCCPAKKIEAYMKGLSMISRCNSIIDIKMFITDKALEIVHINKPNEYKVFSSLVKDTLAIIDDNIRNENLSLRWIAKNHLFTNVDYLGKVFKKEVGTNFSHYVMTKRMELAKELIMGGKKDRIYEVAERVGYGTNSQYFSQVFKKYTGLSPLEYKEAARIASNQ